jgi:hypothetical protein
MDKYNVEDTIRKLNALIPNPNERMSEVAIALMVQLVERSIATTEAAILQVLEDRGIRLNKVN